MDRVPPNRRRGDLVGAAFAEAGVPEMLGVLSAAVSVAFISK